MKNTEVHDAVGRQALCLHVSDLTGGQEIAHHQGTMKEKLGRWVERFNAVYDFGARIVKFLLFVIAVLLAAWQWQYVDWGRTSTGVIEKVTPVQFQRPAPATTPPTTAVAVAPPPTATPPPPPQQQQKEAPPKSSPSPPPSSRKTPPPIRPVPPAPPVPAPAESLPPPTLRSDATLRPDALGIYQFGQLVFSTDRPYEVAGDTVVFAKLLLKGKPDYEKTFLYAEAEIKITRIDRYIGLLVSGGSVEGPVLQGVHAQIVRRD